MAPAHRRVMDAGQKFTINAWGQTVAEGDVLKPTRRVARAHRAPNLQPEAAPAPSTTSGKSSRPANRASHGYRRSGRGETPFFGNSFNGIVDR